MNIDCSKLPSGTPYDGEDIVGNLNAQASDSHLGTISSIQVHIKLVMPTACLKLYSFRTFQDTGSLLDSIQVHTKKTGAVQQTNPGTMSTDALVVNTCGSSQNFDLNVGLDPNWGTIPPNNPGNATFAYDFSGEIDPSTLNITGLSGIASGEVTCLQNVSLPAGDSYLVTVHSTINDGLFASNLPASSTFTFSAGLYTPGTGCSGGLLGTTLVEPSNPVYSTLPFTIQ